MNVTPRKQEIIYICLATFVENGLETSMRDLGKALNLDPTALYAHFKSKDEVVIACAEEAAVRIETDLVGAALKNIENPAVLATDIFERSEKMRPLMNFFVSVCVANRYKEKMKPALIRLSNRYKYYNEKFAEKLDCKTEEIAPYVYTVINTMLSFMIFGQSNFASPQLEMAYDALIGFLEKKNKTTQSKQNCGE